MLRLSVAAFAAICLLSMGCYSAPVMPPSGLIYSNIGPVQDAEDLAAHAAEPVDRDADRHDSCSMRA